MITIALDARLVGGSSTGDSTYWNGLLYGLSKISPTVRFLLLSNAARPQEIPWCDEFSWIQVPARSSRWWSLVAFPLAARRAGAQGIHTQYNLSPLAGRRGITTIHDVSFFVGPEWFKPRDLFLLRRFVPASARRAAKVITVSETSKAEIERFIPEAKGKTIATYLALNPAITPIERARASATVDSEFGIRGPFALTVGTRWPRKNMGLAISAVDLLPKEEPLDLVVTGKPGWGDTRPSERVVAPGYVSSAHLSALYSAADLYLAPSHHEGFGLTLLEAFACGCPVICSSGGAMPEVAGGAARIEKSWQPKDWAQTVKSLLGDSGKLDAMRRKGLERVAQFDWRDTARKTLEVYREVAG
jgi:glycosyltransferase involved in cell wall biosynthesis